MCVACPEPAEDLLALDDALARFSKIDPVAGKLVQLRYFVGLTLAEAAQARHLAAQRGLRPGLAAPRNPWPADENTSA